MAILEIRRHVERGDPGNEESALSPGGRAMAEALAKRGGKYTLVLLSPLPRAKATAQLIAGRLGGTEPGLLPKMGGVIGDRIFGEMRTLSHWAAVLRDREDARTFASELPAITLAERLRARLNSRAAVTGCGAGPLRSRPHGQDLGSGSLSGPVWCGHCPGLGRVRFGAS